MKQVKFLMVALTILMGAMVTSCMDGEENTIVQGLEPMRVNSGYMGMPSTFISGSGIEVVPSNSTMADDLPSDTKMAYVYYQYDRALQTITENTESIKVELLAKPQRIDAPLVVVANEEDPQDAKATHTVTTLSFNGGYLTPFIFPVSEDVSPSRLAEYFLIVPVSYKIKSVTKQEEFDAELKLHSLTAVCYAEEMSGTTLTLHLRHAINEPVDPDKEVSRTVDQVEYKGYDLANAIENFRQKVGHLPTKVVVKAMENQSSNKLDGGSEKTYDREIKIEE